MRESDFFPHVDEDRFGLILPHTWRKEARVFLSLISPFPIGGPNFKGSMKIQ
jgi:hypothetical protein